MNTNLTYFDDSYQYCCMAQILASGSDEYGAYISLSQTIFYPQGGGQPYDVGTIEVAGALFSIHAVRWVGQEVRHYTKESLAHLVGHDVRCTIEAARRNLHARYHTAGHLLSIAVEALYPALRAVKGHHYPEGAYVEFTGAGIVDLIQVNAKLIEYIAQDLPITAFVVSPEELIQLCPAANYTRNSALPIRVMRIGNAPYVPCGGTHVKHLSELERVVATKQKEKQELLKISYEL